jgi:4-hydroxy-tetrahydrodipicolinate reductase
MIRVLVTGGAGRMGSLIARLVWESDEFELSGVVEREDHPLIGGDMGTIWGAEKVEVKLESDFLSLVEKADVYVDFTTPEASLKFLTLAVSRGKPAVIGTTGFTEEDKEFIREQTEKIPVVLAPNMSLGVNLLFYLTKKVGEVLYQRDYDVEIVERHHRHKLDAPSGTEIKLGEIIAELIGKPLEDIMRWGRYGRSNNERSKEEVGIFALRGGEVVGEHTLYFSGVAEEVVITHRAFSRKAFALGALQAAKWIVQQKPGLYDMQDVLGLKEE